MIVTSANAVRDYIISTMPTLFDITNCDVDNVVVFDNILHTNVSSKQCIVVGFGGLGLAGQASEFGGYLSDITMNINYFTLLWGTNDDRHQSIEQAYATLDTLINNFKNDSTLGGKVMDSVITSVSAPLTYRRNEMNEYLMLVMELTLRNNLY